MTRHSLIAAAMLAMSLLGCKPDAPPMLPGEHALANLHEHLKHETGGTRLRPLMCDGGASGLPELLCHADLIQGYGNEEKKIGSSTFSCGAAPGGPCRFVSSADGDRATAAVTAQPCTDSIHTGTSIELKDVGTATVADITNSDTPDQSWVSVSVNLQDASVRLSEEQVNSAVDQLSDRLGAICRSYPLKQTRIFLYPAGVMAGESANWIARLTKAESRELDINRRLLKDERNDRFACLDEKEPGIGGNDGTRLPPVRQREIIGTWADSGFNLTMSLERVKGKVYKVYRSAYCASGERGELLRTVSKGRYAVIGSSNGDYYELTPGGDLGVFDRAGSIDVLPKHFALHPAPAKK